MQHGKKNGTVTHSLCQSLFFQKWNKIRCNFFSKSILPLIFLTPQSLCACKEKKKGVSKYSRVGSGMLRPFCTLCPPGISFAWPSMLPQHTNAQGWDYFDTNIKAADQTESTVHVRWTSGPEGRKHVSWLSCLLPQNLTQQQLTCRVSHVRPPRQRPGRHKHTRHMRITCTGRNTHMHGEVRVRTKSIDVKMEM